MEIQLNEYEATQKQVEATTSFLIEAKHELPVAWTDGINELTLNPLMRMAYDIVRAENAMYVLYIDVGNLPKHKAEQYVKEVMVNYRDKNGKGNLAYFIPVRNSPTRIEAIYKPYTLDQVLAVHDKLRDA